jgi:hypothetical protein
MMVWVEDEKVPLGRLLIKFLEALFLPHEIAKSFQFCFFVFFFEKRRSDEERKINLTARGV